MKQKIVINVPIKGEKAKSKAMQIVVGIKGVSSVSANTENDSLEVIGEGVDSVCLGKSLRKKFCFANIITVEEVKPPKPKPNPPTSPPRYYCPPPCQPYYYAYSVYDSGPPNCCIF